MHQTRFSVESKGVGEGRFRVVCKFFRQEGRIFPKRDGWPGFFYATTAEAGIAVESMLRAVWPAINLLVTQVVNLTQINLLRIV